MGYLKVVPLQITYRYVWEHRTIKNLTQYNQKMFFKKIKKPKNVLKIIKDNHKAF